MVFEPRILNPLRCPESYLQLFRQGPGVQGQPPPTPSALGSLLLCCVICNFSISSAFRPIVLLLIFSQKAKGPHFPGNSPLGESWHPFCDVFAATRCICWLSPAEIFYRNQKQPTIRNHAPLDPRLPRHRYHRRDPRLCWTGRDRRINCQNSLPYLLGHLDRLFGHSKIVLRYQN